MLSRPMMGGMKVVAVAAIADGRKTTARHPDDGRHGHRERRLMARMKTKDLAIALLCIGTGGRAA
jgi:hypothetical protein